jgi:hypothetical protein
MTWAKLDDGFYRHPKSRAAGKDGRALFVASLCWAASHLTDGFIATHDLGLIAAEAEVKPRPTANRLVQVGMWEPVDGGWQIHDYLDFNPTAEAALDKRRKRAEAGRKGGLKSRPPRTKPEAKPEAIASGGSALQNDDTGSRSVSATSPPTGPRPSDHTPPPTSQNGRSSEAKPEAIASANGKQNGTPSPSPYPTKELTSSDYSHTEPDTPDDDQQPRPTQDARIETALAILADRDLEARRAAKGNVGDPVSWTNAAIDRRRASHGAALAEHASGSPDATPELLAAIVDPFPAAPVLTLVPNQRTRTPIDPRDGQQAAAMARAELHRRQLTGQVECQHCQDTGMALDDDGLATPCNHDQDSQETR